MNGTEKIKVPKFMEGEPLPDDYFEPQNPYVLAPSCKVKIGAMAEYARLHGKRIWDLTKEEYKMFQAS